MNKKLLIALALLLPFSKTNAQCTGTITGDTLFCASVASPLQATPGGVLRAAARARGRARGDPPVLHPRVSPDAERQPGDDRGGDAGAGRLV